MSSWPEDAQWGDWVLGDLADLVDRLTDVIGRYTDVELVKVAPPREPETLPTVTMVVADDGGIFRLRSEMAACEYPVRFLGAMSEDGWAAEVAGIRLRVVPVGGE